jgi:hypothetical protein
MKSIRKVRLSTQSNAPTYGWPGIKDTKDYNFPEYSLGGWLKKNLGLVGGILGVGTLGALTGGFGLLGAGALGGSGAAAGAAAGGAHAATALGGGAASTLGAAGSGAAAGSAGLSSALPYIGAGTGLAGTVYGGISNSVRYNDEKQAQTELRNRQRIATNEMSVSPAGGVNMNINQNDLKQIPGQYFMCGGKLYPKGGILSNVGNFFMNTVPDFTTDLLVGKQQVPTIGTDRNLQQFNAKYGTQYEDYNQFTKNKHVPVTIPKFNISNPKIANTPQLDETRELDKYNPRLNQTDFNNFAVGGIQQFGVNPNAELERGEPFRLPDGRIFNIPTGAPTHAQGGVQLGLPGGTEILGNNKATESKEFKQLGLKLKRVQDKADKSIEEPSTSLSRSTALRNLNNVQLEWDRLMKTQESQKGNESEENMEYKKGGWISKAVNPKHKGFCTPITKSTCTPRRKAFAMTMKKHHGFHKKEDGGYIEYAKGGLTPEKAQQILHDGTVYGKPITDKQRKFFGSIISKHADGGKISLDRQELRDEHNKLLGILRTGTKKERFAEAAKQQKEMKKYLKGGLTEPTGNPVYNIMKDFKLSQRFPQGGQVVKDTIPHGNVWSRSGDGYDEGYSRYINPADSTVASKYFYESPDSTMDYENRFGQHLMNVYKPNQTPQQFDINHPAEDTVYKRLSQSINNLTAGKPKQTYADGGDVMMFPKYQEGGDYNWATPDFIHSFADYNTQNPDWSGTQSVSKDPDAIYNYINQLKSGKNKYKGTNVPGWGTLPAMQKYRSVYKPNSINAMPSVGYNDSGLNTGLPYGAKQNSYDLATSNIGTNNSLLGDASNVYTQERYNTTKAPGLDPEIFNPKENKWGNYAMMAGIAAPMLYNLGRGLFEPSANISPDSYRNPNEDEALGIMRKRKYDYNIDPLLYEIRVGNRIGDTNVKNYSRSTGEMLNRMQGNVAQRNRSMTEAYTQKYNLENQANNQYQGEYANALLGAGQQRAGMKWQADMFNLQSKEAKRGLIGTALSQGQQGIQQYLLMRNKQKADSLRIKALQTGLENYKLDPELYKSLIQSSLIGMGNDVNYNIPMLQVGR